MFFTAWLLVLTGAWMVPTVGQQQEFPDIDLRLECDAEPGPDSRLEGRAYIRTRNESEPEKGVQGWTLSIAADGDLQLVDATTDGTVAAAASDDPPGLSVNGFEQIELVDPDFEPLSGPLQGLGPQGSGVVSAVILSLIDPITLPANSDSLVLRLTAEVDTSGECTSGALTFRDGLQGSGLDVENAVTYSGVTRKDDGGESDNDGDSTEPCALLIGACGGFVRGNCDATGDINLTDAIFGLNYLFLAGTVPPCIKACDVNDDNALNLTDPVVILNFLFLAGPAPRAPYPLCGEDPTPDPLTCEEPHPDCG